MEDSDKGVSLQEKDGREEVGSTSLSRNRMSSAIIHNLLTCLMVSFHRPKQNPRGGPPMTEIEETGRSRVSRCVREGAGRGAERLDKQRPLTP